VIGLDIGTNAVRAVELTFGRGRPVLGKMGQIGLPLGAVVAGEIVEPTAVSAALRRLWREVGFTNRTVVVGVANSRVVARVADLPPLPENELRSSLQYHVQDLIPMPVGDAELDLRVLDPSVVVNNQQRARVLLVAAHKVMLATLLAALEGANLKAASIDLVPFALVRALHETVTPLESADGSEGGREVIVGIGAGVTNVIVHEDGVPRFVRTLPTGSSLVTDAIAGELEIDVDQAEGAKRGFGELSTSTALTEITRSSVAPLANDVSGTLDFHLAQSGHSGLERVIISGGGARLEGMRVALAEQLGATVVIGDPLAGIDFGKARLAPEVLEDSGDLFTVAIGLALSGQPRTDGTHRISLLPAHVTARQTERRQAILVGAGIAGVAVVAVALTYGRGVKVNHAKAEAARAEASVTALQSQVNHLQDVTTLQAKIATQRQLVTASLTRDVAWPDLIKKITASLPADVWLDSFGGAVARDGSGSTIKVSASGTSHDAVAHWLQEIAKLPEVSDLWVSSASKEPGNMPVKFDSTATLTPSAGSQRSARIAEETK
jgi:type IV pilus assembly protein PilM